MRLTLRALLAYLYNVLDPADAEDFAGKVQESAVASGLVQRIGGITHKMRMNAPRIDARGLVDDANNVAEYLDNSLSDERVADFERACINSDQHLAEVASSYQILTMVLGKPAHISQTLKTRIYTLPLDLATAHREAGERDGAERKRMKKTMEKVAQSGKEADAAAHAVHTTSTHSVPHVPDYLREQRASTWWLGALALALVALALGIRAFGPYDHSNRLIGGMFKAPAAVADADTPDAQAAQDAQTSEIGTSADQKGTGTGTTVPVDRAEDDQADEASDKTGKTKASRGDETAAAAASDDGPGPPVPPVDAEVASSASEKGSAKATSETTEKASNDKGSAEKGSGDAAAADVPPDAPIDPMDVGRYVSDDQVLTRFDGMSKLWMRVPPRDILASGERLVVLPTYRPQIALASGVQVTFAGESAVEMQEPLHAGASQMKVEYGRFLVVTLGNAGSQLELNLQGVQGILTLVDSDSEVAIDVRHYLPPGSDPAKDERILVIALSATNGNARWDEVGTDSVEIPMHHVLEYMAGSERALSGPYEAPVWIDATSLSDIDRLTSLELQKGLQLDKPVHIRLQEMMSDRRVDVRALSARCLTSLGEFDPIIRELGNPQQKSFWAAEIDVLRRAMTRGPETQALIFQSLERLRPREAETLFRLLLGYSPEQLQGTGAEELVTLLESPEMDVRVLASDTLRQITGVQLLYRPEKAPSENRASINRWKERQAEGTIAYVVPPSPLSERQPLEKRPAGGAKAPTRKDNGKNGIAD